MSPSFLELAWFFESACFSGSFYTLRPSHLTELFLRKTPCDQLFQLLTLLPVLGTGASGENVAPLNGFCFVRLSAPSLPADRRPICCKSITALEFP